MPRNLLRAPSAAAAPRCTRPGDPSRNPLPPGTSAPRELVVRRPEPQAPIRPAPPIASPARSLARLAGRPRALPHLLQALDRAMPEVVIFMGRRQEKLQPSLLSEQRGGVRLLPARVIQEGRNPGGKGMGWPGNCQA